MRPLRRTDEKIKKWHCQNGRPGGRRWRAEATDRLIWGSMWKSVKETGAPQNATEGVLNDTGEACRTRGPPKWEIPSRAVPCSPRYRALSIESSLRQSYFVFVFFCWFFFSRWYIWIIPHMHTFTVQGCPVCHQRLKSSEVVTCRDLGGRIDRKVTMHEKPLLQSVVSHCRFLLQREVFDGLSKTRKSHLQIITIKKNSSRDGKRSAMYRLNRPVETKTAE